MSKFNPMNGRKVYLISLTLALLLSCGQKSDDPVGGVVSINANVGSDPFSAYTTEFQAIFAAGARGTQTAAPWASLNPTGTTYDLTMITNSFFGLGALTGYGYATIFLNIPIITIASRSMPADIASTAFDDPAVISRFHALIDQVVPYLNSNVKYISLGNEVDTYLSAHPAEWSQYKTLIDDARSYIKSLKPNILIGVTTTFDGATSTQTANVASLNQNMDIIILTYYPINPMTFVPRPPSTVSTDMVAMGALGGSKPVVMQEFGYPSSTVLSSSESNQSAFITNTFATWKQLGAAKFPFISFFKWRDWSSTYCSTVTGQSAGGSFFEFMCSLGYLNHDGTSKAAYQILLNQM